MSVYGIENALWQASMNPKKAQLMREDAESYLKDFSIDKQECAAVASWDVRDIVERGVNPMVVMMANAAVNGPAAAMTYVQKVNTPKAGA